MSYGYAREPDKWLFMCESYGPGTWDALAEALDLRPGDLAISWERLDDLLGPPVRSDSGGGGAHSEWPPDLERWGGYFAALDSKPRLRKRLRRERGLTLKTQRHHGIGWDSVRFGYVLPIYDEHHDLVNLSWRAPKDQLLRLPGGARKMTRLRRGIEDGALPLYPDVPPEGPLLLAEGEWDALIARQEGLPAVTGLLGMQWNPAWDEHVVGRRVAVAYDTGAEDHAARTVEQLRAAGAEAAWVVPLGLPEHGDDLVDWFVTHGRTADELKDLIRSAGWSA